MKLMMLMIRIMNVLIVRNSLSGQLCMLNLLWINVTLVNLECDATEMNDREKIKQSCFCYSSKCSWWRWSRRCFFDWMNTCIAHISILSNAHDAWSMFWPVLRRCHILRWDWSVLPLGASFHFPFWELLVHAGFCMFPQSCDLRTETAGSL
jgi:hypothetical protein